MAEIYKDGKMGDKIREILCSLPEAQRKRMIRDIAVISERTYRKGFQQGVTAAQKCSFIELTKEKLYKWRYSAPLWCKQLPRTPGLGIGVMDTLAAVMLERVPNWFGGLVRSVYPNGSLED